MNMLAHEKQIQEYEKTLSRLKEQNHGQKLWCEEICKLEEKLDVLKKKVYSELTPWQRIAICRHSSRPHSIDYIKNVFDEFEELSGDRLFRDDKAIIGGLARIGNQKFMVIGQEKGHDTASRLKHNFGMPHPEGYRKALRLMKMAEKFHLPVITFLDTPGAYPGLTAEERGQGWAIATNLLEMAKLKTPILVMIIGEGCSGGALGMGIGDNIAMLEHAYYSVISPEGCASILYKDSSKSDIAAASLKMHAEELKKLDVIDTIIKEPLGGAHHDPKTTYERVKKHILKETDKLNLLPEADLLEMRYLKFRRMGKFSVESETGS